MNEAAFRKLALSFAETEARPHFERTAFRTPRRTFATLSGDGRDVNVMLEPDQQAMVTSASSAFTKLPNKWGDQGWTRCVLKDMTVAQLRPVLQDAHARALEPVSKRSMKRR